MITTDQLKERRKNLEDAKRFFIDRMDDILPPDNYCLVSRGWVAVIEKIITIDKLNI
jgi:hypothetical protein